MPQGLFIGATRYGAGIRLAFGYHRHLFGRTAAAAFAQVFRAAFDELAAIGRETPPAR
ncbi:hypothetical protein [Frankia sp. AvcI1]|uniref:hypothetical protein n=1 Tax=Frankia sp. AvcI1 TaxID=573496 RepID=UPI001F2207E8|nr:hypothetical protein [Frankia sp. AvcI1]